jgi:hypothetical protein
MNSNPNKWTHKATGSALAIAMALSLQGCTDQELATGLGVVAIGAGAAAIGVAHGSSDRHRDRHRHGRGRSICEGGYEYRCTTYRDYWGYERRECRNEWNSCRYSRWQPYGSADVMSLELDANLSSFATNSSPVHKLEETPVEPGKWAETFKLSFDAAEFLTSSLEQAREGEMQALLDLGLSHKDVRNMAREKMPSNEAVDLLARNLNQRPENTREMLQTLLNEGSKIKKNECKRRVVGSRRGPFVRSCR